MTRLSEQPRKKLVPLMGAGEELLAAVQFEHLNTGTTRNQRLAAFAEALGLDSSRDLAWEKRAVYGYLGVSTQRLVVAKSPMFWKVKPKHVFIEAPISQCRMHWYDFEGGIASGRAMLVQAPHGRFASMSIALRWLGQFGHGQEEALRENADAVVRAFGAQAVLFEEENEV